MNIKSTKKKVTVTAIDSGELATLKKVANKAESKWETSHWDTVFMVTSNIEVFETILSVYDK